MTVRESDNWNVQDGKKLTLGDFFPSCADYEKLIKKEIVRQIEIQHKKNPNTYFENYKELVEQNFKADNYYIKTEPCQLVFYFQQYEITPYSTGIPEFAIPVKN